MKTKALAIVITILATCPAWAQRVSTCETQPKITVNGSAVVKVKPDKIIISFGVEILSKEIMVAKEENNKILKRAMGSIKELGIPTKEIQTDHLSVQPRYKNDYTRKNFIGYAVRNTFTVTLSKVSQVEVLVTKALQDGVTHIHGIEFQTSDFKKYREQARVLALKAAKEKAVKMAAVLDQSVGSPMQIQEGYNRSSPWNCYSSWSWGRGHGRGLAMSQNTIQNIQGGSDDVSDAISLGKIAISANVNVTFALKDKVE